MKNYLSRFGLPDSVNSLSNGASLPNQLWEKIQQFQKQGGNEHINKGLRDNKNFIAGIVGTIQSIDKILTDEA
jgi:hypothetical protein